MQFLSSNQVGTGGWVFMVDSHLNIVVEKERIEINGLLQLILL